MYLTTRETAELLGVSEKWVYLHAVELGATKTAAAPNGHLRIPSSSVANFLKARQAELVETRA